MKKFKYLPYIIFLNITTLAIMNIISGKVIGVWIFTLSAASLLDPINYLIGDTVTEVYGYKQARRTNWILLGSSVLTAVFLQLAVWLPPAHGFAFGDAYAQVLGQVPRVVLGAWVALFCGQFLNDFVLAKMKILTKGKYLWTRTISSTAAGQAVDTTFFYVIVFLGVIPNSLLLTSILSAWFLKVIIEVAITPLAYYVVKKLKKVEKVDHFDHGTNFNPFAIKQFFR